MKASSKRSSDPAEFPPLRPAQRRRYLQKLLKQLLAGKIALDPKDTGPLSPAPYRRVIE